MKQTLVYKFKFLFLFIFTKLLAFFSLNHYMICSDFELSHHSNTSAVPVESKQLSIEAFG